MCGVCMRVVGGGGLFACARMHVEMSKVSILCNNLSEVHPLHVRTIQTINADVVKESEKFRLSL